MKKGFANVVILILVFLGVGVLGYFAWQNVGGFKSNLTSTTPTVSRNSPTANPTNTPVSAVTEVPSNWKTHSSKTFNYSFKYPPTWNLLAYNEEDPSVLYGTNTLQNYSVTEIENFMNHGIVDWKKFIGDKPAVKIDFSVLSKKKSKVESFDDYFKNSIEGSTLIPQEDLKIGNLTTRQYKNVNPQGPTDMPETNLFVAEIDSDRIVWFSLYFSNIDSYEKLKLTDNWGELEQILSTYEFKKI